MLTVITGASRGIGAALREHCLAAGQEVIATARETEGLVPLDVSDPDGFGDLRAAIGARPLDLLVCNAGIYADKGQDIDTGYAPELWAQSFATNVTGVFLSIQTLLPNLGRAKTPKIAIISSQMASQDRAPGGSYIYRASKAAALNLGRNLAADLRRRGIAVGVYHPGWVRTDMGGGSAELSADQSAAGLVDRFTALSLANTGCFETWDGRAHPF